MSVEEKAYLLTQANKLFHRPIKADSILNIVKEAEIIDYSSFMAITTMTKLLSSKEQ